MPPKATPDKLQREWLKKPCHNIINGGLYLKRSLNINHLCFAFHGRPKCQDTLEPPVRMLRRKGARAPVERRPDEPALLPFRQGYARLGHIPNHNASAINWGMPALASMTAFTDFAKIQPASGCSGLFRKAGSTFPSIELRMTDISSELHPSYCFIDKFIEAYASALCPIVQGFFYSIFRKIEPFCDLPCLCISCLKGFQ